MTSLSINHLTLLNAVFLLFLGTYMLLRQGSRVSGIFFLSCFGLALWNAFTYLLDMRYLTEYANLWVRVQLFGAMIFVVGIMYFSHSYPYDKIGHWHIPNLLVLAGISIAMFFTPYVSVVEIVDGEMRYDDGPGFAAYTIYLNVMGISALLRLVRSYREYPEYRDRIRYFFYGISFCILNGLVFNMILPTLGYYDYLIMGRLGATVAPLAIFYAMTKHEFMDASVIINKNTAWLGTLGILLSCFIVADQATRSQPWVHMTVMAVLIVIAALFSHQLQTFLLTTAKRKFVRGWYSTEEVFNELSRRITQEKNREALFREVLKVIDEVFELETSLSLVAIRDEEERFSYYKLMGSVRKISADDPLVACVSNHNECLLLEDASEELLARLGELQFNFSERGVVLPFHSPEYLEGMLVLGERSNQEAFTEADIKFFNNLISFMSPVLYRLTPMEKLEQLYNESRQRLHEAEIQLIRAQKVDSIAHATRQCHHEIRTPLNIIRMGIGRVKTLDDLENYKRVAQEEIDHALSVVDETLAITEVNNVEQRRLSPVNMNDVIQRCLRLIDRSRYSVELDLNEIPPVLGQGGDLQVVIINLIHNAIDAMPEGGSLAFSTRAAHEQVEIDVEDTGTGIPEEMRSRVWEPYVSGKPTEVGNSTAGRGWGLTIVNRIINEHGGTINFTSVENQGTRFTISLPLAIGERGEHAGDAETRPRIVAS